MAVSFSELIQSRNLKFYVGEDDGTPAKYVVHEEAIARLSPHLKNHLQKETEVNQKPRVVWKHVGKETFEKFVQFAYTGDYSIAEGEERTSREDKEVKTLNGQLASILNALSLQVQKASTQEDLADPLYPADPVDPEDFTWGYSQSSKKKQRKGKGKKEKTKSSFLNNWGTSHSYDSFEEPEAVYASVETVADPVEEPEVVYASVETVADPVEELEPVYISAETVEPDDAFIPTEIVEEPGAVYASEEPIPEAEPTLENPTPLKGLKSVGVKLVTDLKELNYAEYLVNRNHYASTTEPSTIFNSNINYSPILLSHAALYFLASSNEVHALKVLTLYKLHKTLLVFVLDDTNICNIVDLVRYSYEKCDGDVGCELRTLVCQFLVLNAVALSGYDEFMRLLKKGGQFVEDFFRFEVQRKR
ncbi:hypothetical protein BGZ60DRAFT_436726 [Tricladium varicosporioides]|nr:hypothetical protein BGZ60DRAFT_436726 [Hymenoscyphus varicosporioides]